MAEVETVPCKFCGKPTVYTATELCVNCHEVVSRFPEFVKSNEGWAWALEVLQTEAREKRV